MPKFDVTVTRDTTESVVVRVDAASRAEALVKAVQRARNDKLAWKAGEHYIDPPYASHSVEVVDIVNDLQRDALANFVTAIDDGGGVVKDSRGNYQPVMSPRLIDVGNAYMEACKALEREPRLGHPDDLDEEMYEEEDYFNSTGEES